MPSLRQVPALLVLLLAAGPRLAPAAFAADAVPPPPGGLSVVVVDAATGDPVPGAIVVLDGEHDHKVDKAGRLTLPRLSPGPHLVTVVSGQHALFEETVEVPSGRAVALRSVLAPAGPEVLELVQKVKRPRVAVTEVTLAQEEVKKVPGTFGDPVRVIENLPGLSRTPGGMGGTLIIRGANPADSGVYLDGIEIPMLYHFGGLTSVVNADLLGEVTFMPGGFGASYGRATGGIVAVESKPLGCDRTRGAVAVDPIDAELYLCQPIGRWKLAAATRRSYVDAFLPSLMEAAAEEGEAVTVVSPAYFDYQIKVETARERHRFEIFAFGSRDTLKVTRTASAEDTDLALGGTIAFHRLQLRHTTFVGDLLTLESALVPGYLSNDIGQSSKDLNAAHHSRAGIATLGWRETLTYRLSDPVTIRGGLDHQLYHWYTDFVTDLTTLTRRFPTPLDFDLSRQSPWKSSNLDLHQGYWAELVLSPLETLSFTTGVRVGHLDFDSTERWTLEPRLSARWQAAPSTAFKAAAGVYEKLPDLFSGLMVEGFGQPALDAERARHLTGGLEQDLGLLSLGLEGFHVWRDRLPSPTDEVVFVDGKPQPVLFKSDGEGRVFGLELLVRRAPARDRRFSGWVSYTLSRAYRKDRTPDGVAFDQWDGAHPGTPREGGLSATSREYLSPFDQTHIATAVGQWTLPWNMSLGFRLQYVSGNPITPFERGDARYDADADQYRVTPGTVSRNSDRLPAVQRLDLRLDKRWQWQSWALTAYLEVINTTNNRPVEAYGYDYRYRTRTEMRGLPILPVLGFKGEI